MWRWMGCGYEQGVEGVESGVRVLWMEDWRIGGLEEEEPEKSC